MFKMKVAALALVAVFGIGAVAVASPVAGTGVDSLCLAGNGQVTYHEYVFGNETFAVAIDGDGSSLLSVYVYGQNGVLIASDTGYNPSVNVIPYFTQEMRIVVVNHGYFHNCFGIAIA